MAIKLHGSFAVHPGVWLRTEIVDAYGLSVTTTAAFGPSADTLLRMQAAHDLAEARSREKSIKVERVAA